MKYTPPKPGTRGGVRSGQFADRLIERMAEEDEGVAPRLSFDELYRLIEKALVENDAYDVAKSLVISRSNDGSSVDDINNAANSGISQIRLIRRSGQVVPWNSAKIEVAVRKAFLSLDLIQNLRLKSHKM